MKPKHIFAAASLLAAGLVSAHHSGAMFDSARSQTLVGTVTEFNWVNPHSSFKIEVPGPDGKPVVWAVEMNTPQNLVREGWKRTSIKAGDKITAVVHPLRDGKPGGSYVSVKLADGTLLSGGAQQLQPANAPRY
jgi:hypothetical protein